MDWNAIRDQERQVEKAEGEHSQSRPHSRAERCFKRDEHAGSRDHRDGYISPREYRERYREDRNRWRDRQRNRNDRNDWNGFGRLPSRWTDYAALGAEVSGTPFLPFKTPLRPEFNNKLRKDWIFEVETLLKCATDNNRRIGLVIDLTNTDRYYDTKLWEDHGIRHEKIKNSGQEIHLQQGLFDRFKIVVDEFMHVNNGSDMLIGVHCTHGLNRTGYLICRYMIEVLQIDAKQAIREFERSRGYAMERDTYVTSLKEISDGLQEETNNDDWEDMTLNKRIENLELSKKQSWLELPGSPQPEVVSDEGADSVTQQTESDDGKIKIAIP